MSLLQRLREAATWSVVNKSASDELTLNGLLARYVDPIMKPVGARKRGRRYVRENEGAMADIDFFRAGGRSRRSASTSA